MSITVVSAIITFLAEAAQLGGGVIIGFAIAEAFLRAGKTFFLSLRSSSQFNSVSVESTRLRLGRWLSLALEFQLAADILKTAVAPTWDEIGQLAAIAVLRTALNFFLQREVEKSVDGRAMGNCGL